MILDRNVEYLLSCSDRSLVSHEWNDYQKYSTLNPFGLNQTEYLKQYPRSKNSRLSACKSAIYNPKLPTVKQMWQDDVLCKLPQEHSRHTTWLSKKDFDNFKFYSRKTPTKDLSSLVSSRMSLNYISYLVNELFSSRKVNK